MTKKVFSYKAALETLYRLQKYGIKFGLSKTSNLLKAFGNPHYGKKYIHVAGSNGKGSVAAMMASILMESGLRVGFYSSPHLVRFTERFRINNEEIAPDRAAELTGELMDVVDPQESPTFFEAVTALALRYFALEEVDIAIMEVGMGGRLDATNIITPLVSVITNISLEHQEFLGARLIDIAKEKAGIIKPGVDVVTAVSQPHLLELFRTLCRQKGAPFWRVGRDVRYRETRTGFHYTGIERRFRGLNVGLRGTFQKRNAATALAVIELLDQKGFPVSSGDIRKGLKGATWPGRMHVISQHPTIVLDGAHNPAAMKILIDAVRRYFVFKRLVLILGVMEDKDIPGMISIVVGEADYVIYTKPDYYRSALPQNLMKEAAHLDKPGEISEGIGNAINRAKTVAGSHDLILICGSLFTVGEALTCLDPEAYKPDG